MSVAAVHDELVARLRSIDGHSDMLGLLAEAGFLARAAAAVAEPFRDAPVDRVAGIEARGFVLAAAVALELGAGFVAIRKPGAIHPGPKAELRAPPDWRGNETVAPAPASRGRPGRPRPRRLGRNRQQGAHRKTA